MKTEGTKAPQSSNSKDAWKSINATTFRSRGEADSQIDPETLNAALAATVQAKVIAPLTILDNSYQSDTFVFHPLTVDKVSRLLSGIKPNTAMGPDELPASFLCQLASIVECC